MVFIFISPPSSWPHDWEACQNILNQKCSGGKKSKILVGSNFSGCLTENLYSCFEINPGKWFQYSFLVLSKKRVLISICIYIYNHTLWKGMHQTANSAYLWEGNGIGGLGYREAGWTKSFHFLHSVFFSIFFMFKHVFLYYFYYLKIHILLNSYPMEF